MFLEIDGATLGVVITVLVSIISLAAWMGALSQKVNHNEKGIEDDRNTNRQDHQLIFSKLDEIGKYIRNGHGS